MTKEEARQKLKKSGYNVIDDNSVVTVVIDPEVSIKNALKDVKSKLNAWGYDASFGIRQLKGAKDMGTGDSLADSEEDINVSGTDDLEVVSDNSVEEKMPGVIDDDKSENVKNEVKSSQENSNADDASEGETDSLDDDEYYDEEDSDMLLTEESIQFSLEDFGLDF